MSTARHARTAVQRRAASTTQLSPVPSNIVDPSDLGHLVNLIAAGDRTAFGRFYDLTAPQVFAVVSALVLHPRDREAVTLRAYTQIWRYAASLAPDADALAWAVKIASSEARIKLQWAYAADYPSDDARSATYDAWLHPTPASEARPPHPAFTTSRGTTARAGVDSPPVDRRSCSGSDPTSRG